MSIRANTDNARILGIVRSVRNVRSFEKEPTSEPSSGPALGSASRVFGGLDFKPPIRRTPRSNPLAIGELSFFAADRTPKLRTYSNEPSLAMVRIKHDDRSAKELLDKVGAPELAGKRQEDRSRINTVVAVGQ
jgi:hypothetical protein